MNIVGLGSAGCNIADAFSQYPQYNIFKIDTDISGDRCYSVPKLSGAEEYEKYSFPKLDSFFGEIRKNKEEVMFIVGGSGEISCASLKILQKLKRNDITVIYIQPDLGILNERQKMIENLVRGVFQEYARSGVFKRLFLISNQALDNMLGGAPIIGYYDTLNELLVSSIHMINVFENTKPLVGSPNFGKETHRIVSLGMLIMEENTEKMFFNIDNPRSKCYLYSIAEEELKTNKELFSRLKLQVKSKEEENLEVSFAIYPNDFGRNIAYIIEKTPHTQN